MCNQSFVVAGYKEFLGRGRHGFYSNCSGNIGNSDSGEDLRSSALCHMVENRVMYNGIHVYNKMIPLL